MVAEPPSYAELLAAAPGYFEAPIARNLIVVSLCARDKSTETWADGWAAYAAANNYALLGLADVSAASQALGVHRNYLQRAQRLVARGQCETAEKMLRWALLAHHGGVMVGPRMAAPKNRRAGCALESLLELPGLVVLAGKHARNTRPGASGLTVTDSLVLAATGHPVIRALERTLIANIGAVRHFFPETDAAYSAGSILLTRMLTGSFTVLPRLFTTAMPEEDADDA